MSISREQLLQELPRLIKEHPEFRQTIIDMMRPYFADRTVTEGRFEAMLAELRRLREESDRRWEATQAELRRLREESDRRWEATQAEIKALWAEVRRLREESDRRWEATQAEIKALWAEVRRLREESDRRWQQWHQTWQEFLAAYRETMNKHQLAIERLDRRIHVTLSAIGSRWGRRTEAAFRRAIVGILHEYAPEVQVEHLELRDEAGEVFGRPALVELDLFIHNGRWILGEIKASMEVGQVYLFLRKAEFVEKHLQRPIDRLIIISPMIEPEAIEVARQMGVTVYTYPAQAAEDFRDTGN